MGRQGLVRLPGGLVGQSWLLGAGSAPRSSAALGSPLSCHPNSGVLAQALSPPGGPSPEPGAGTGRRARGGGSGPRDSCLASPRSDDSSKRTLHFFLQFCCALLRPCYLFSSQRRK